MALEQIATLPGTPALRREQIKLQVALITPLMIGHGVMGGALVLAGDVVESRAHYDQVIALYEPAAHRALATRFGQDRRVTALSFQSLGLWLLGYPDAARRDAHDAVQSAREVGQAGSLMLALGHTAIPHTLCGNCALGAAHAQELVALAEEKGSLFWKALGMMRQGSVFALNGKALDAVEMLISGITAVRTTAATFFIPFHLAHLARAHADLGQCEEAWRCIGEATKAVEANKEKWCEAEVYRTAGEISLMGVQGRGAFCARPRSRA